MLRERLNYCFCYSRSMSIWKIKKAWEKLNIEVRLNLFDIKNYPFSLQTLIMPHLSI